MLTVTVVVARSVAMLWGAHSVATRDMGSFEEMITKVSAWPRHRFAAAGSKLAMMAGVPFGQAGATNLVDIVSVSGDELGSPDD